MAEKKIQRRSYGPPNADGFREAEEESVAYCPREKKKKTPKEHRECRFHEKEGFSKDEIDQSAPCSFDEEETEGVDESDEKREE